MPIPVALVATMVVAAMVALVVPGPAAAAKPCWKVLLNDWFDGRIDNAYPVSCYRAAIKNLPEDVASYSNARDEINRALLAAINKSKAQGHTLTGKDPVPPQTGPIGDTSSTGETDTTDTTGGTGGEAAPPGGGNDGGPISDVFKPSNADSIPIPLLVLAGLALLLLAAASAGFVARRLQARKAGPPRPPHRPEPR